MKYLREFNKFDTNELIHETRIERICDMKIPDPEHGDLKLSVFPFEHNGEWIKLPEGFKMWEESLNKVMELVPLQEGANTHYVTIDSKFFTKDEFLRREGIHADGNFCVDPKFVSNESLKDKARNFKLDPEFKSSWGGASPKPTWGGARVKPNEFKTSWGGAGPKPTWGGARLSDYVVKEDNSHVSMDWVLPYNIVIPIGDYISEKKGGIFCVSTELGCQGWKGKFEGEVLSEGNYDMMTEQLTDDKKVIFEKDNLYFMTSNTPHETLLISKGKRRTFMRVTLNHEYMNENIGY